MQKRKRTGDVAAAYDKAARSYNLMNRLYFMGRDRRYRSMLVDRLDLKPEHVVLNLCCGTGLDFPFLLEQTKTTGKLVGADISSKMLRQARRKDPNKDVELVRSDAAHLPFPDRTFNAVLVSFCLKVTPEYKKAVEEAVRLLKYGGRIGVLANHKPSGPLQLVGPMITSILSAMANIDFEIKLREFFSRKTAIVEDRKLHGGLVQLLVGEKSSKAIHTHRVASPHLRQSDLCARCSLR